MNGTKLALGTVAALAAASSLSGRGSRARWGRGRGEDYGQSEVVPRRDRRVRLVTPEEAFKWKQSIDAGLNRNESYYTNQYEKVDRFLGNAEIRVHEINKELLDIFFSDELRYFEKGKRGPSIRRMRVPSAWPKQWDESRGGYWPAGHTLNSLGNEMLLRTFMGERMSRGEIEWQEWQESVEGLPLVQRSVVAARNKGELPPIYTWWEDEYLAHPLVVEKEGLKKSLSIMGHIYKTLEELLDNWPNVYDTFEERQMKESQLKRAEAAMSSVE